MWAVIGVWRIDACTAPGGAAPSRGALFDRVLSDRGLVDRGLVDRGRSLCTRTKITGDGTVRC